MATDEEKNPPGPADVEGNFPKKVYDDSPEEEGESED
jgi:hypothetical protein